MRPAASPASNIRSSRSLEPVQAVPDRQRMGVIDELLFSARHSQQGEVVEDGPVQVGAHGVVALDLAAARPKDACADVQMIPLGKHPRIARSTAPYSRWQTSGRRSGCPSPQVCGTSASIAIASARSRRRPESRAIKSAEQAGHA